MCPDSGLPPEEDIQQALQQAQNSSVGNEADQTALAAREVLTESHGCPILGLRYTMAKCGIMAEKYPWQTTVVLLATTACAWVCSYFGAALLVGLVLYAFYSDD